MSTALRVSLRRELLSGRHRERTFSGSSLSA